MSLDAQDWVWNHSKSKGTARLVLLAIADKASGKDCSAYAGTTMLLQRTNASRRAVITAIDVLLDSMELAVVDGKKGPKGETRYSLPQAVGHRRGKTEGGADSAPVQILHRCEKCTGGGAESAPGGCKNCTGEGADSAPHNAVNAEHPDQPEPEAEENPAAPSPFAERQQQHDDSLAAAASFLEALPAPWTIGPRTAAAMAPDLLKMTRAQGWDLDDTLAAKLTEKPGGIHSYPPVLRLRIADLPKQAKPAPRPTAAPLPDWCGDCADGNRAAIRQGRLRLIYDDAGNGRPCPKCHPTQASIAA